MCACSHGCVSCVLGDPASTGQVDRGHEGERRCERNERLLANVLVEKETLLPLLSERRSRLSPYHYVGVDDVPYLFWQLSTQVYTVVSNNSYWTVGISLCTVWCTVTSFVDDLALVQLLYASPSSFTCSQIPYKLYILNDSWRHRNLQGLSVWVLW